MNSWHELSAQEAFRQLDARPEGLTATEAADRLTHFGRNEITRRKPVSPLRLLIKQFSNYFIYVLLFAAALVPNTGIPRAQPQAARPFRRAQPFDCPIVKFFVHRPSRLSGAGLIR